MSNTMPSANMGLPIPVVGVDPGPDWALNYDACLTLVDSHDHSLGNGVAITPAGLDINSDLAFGGNNATNFRSLRFTSQSVALAGAADLGCLYEVAADLYYNDGLGNQVRITQNGNVAGSQGSIANLTSPASASYVSVSETFVWQSDSNVAANLDARSIILRNSSASSKGLTLNPPNSMAANYSLTLPSLPGATNFLAISSSGVITAFAATSAGITGAMIASGTITNVQIASQTILGANILDATITGAKIASATITGSNLASATIAGSNIASATITGTNIASATIAGSNIAAATVTGSNIVNSSIGNSKIEAINSADSSSSGSFSTASSTPQLVCSVTIPAIGVSNHGVAVYVSPINSGSPASGSISYSGGGSAIFEINRGGTSIFRSTMGAVTLPPGVLNVFDDTPGSGAHTYDFYAYTSGTGTVSVTNVLVRVVEII